MLLVITALPDGPEAFGRIAEATGMTLADVRYRLTGALPRVLLSDSNADRITELNEAVNRLGARSLCVEPTQIPTDAARLQVRWVELEGNTLAAFVGMPNQTRHEILLESLALLQRGARSHQTSETHTSKKRKLAVGKAIATGGIVLTKTVSTTTTTTSTDKEQFLLAHRRDGGPDLIFYESKMDYHFLDEEKQSSRFANFQRFLAWLRQRLPETPYQERLLAPGLVRNLPPVAADPIDLLAQILYLDHEQARATHG